MSAEFGELSQEILVSEKTVSIEPFLNDCALYLSEIDSELITPNAERISQCASAQVLPV